VTAWIEIGGRVRKVEVPAADGAAAAGEMRCVVDGRPVKADARIVSPGVISLVLGGGRQVRCILDVSPLGEAVLVDGRRFEFALSDPRSLRAGHAAAAGADGPKAVKAPMPGRVVRVLVSVGDEVAAQQGLVVIEAMKMQNELKAPKAGRVVRLGAGIGDTVQAGEVLVVVE
jgi:acetyl/propionyl-CoA carboxylase alpha subunit